MLCGVVIDDGEESEYQGCHKEITEDLVFDTEGAAWHKKCLDEAKATFMADLRSELDQQTED